MARATRGDVGESAAMARPPRDAVLRELLAGWAGWTSLTPATRPVRVLGRQYQLTAAAARGRWRIHLCERPGSPQLPAYAARRLLQRTAGEAALTVFTDGAGTRQVWGWTRRMPYAADAYTEEYVDPGDPPDPARLLEESAGVEADDPAAAAEGAEAVRVVLLTRLRRNPQVGPLLRRGVRLPAAVRLQRLIEGVRGVGVPRAVWRETTGLRVLDPACGTGSWLAGCLAALSAVAAACLLRMRAWVHDRAGTRAGREVNLRRLLARQCELAGGYGRDRYAREAVLLGCLYGVEASHERAARARGLLARQLHPASGRASGEERLAFADVRVGRLVGEPGALLEAAERGQRVRTAMAPAGVASEAEALGRAWEQVVRVRLLAGAPEGEVREGREEIRRRREALYRLLPRPEECERGVPHLHPLIEFDEVVRAGGFQLVRQCGAAGAGEGDDALV